MGGIYRMAEYGATLFDSVVPIVFLAVLFGKKTEKRRSVYYMGIVVMAFLNMAAVSCLEGKDALQTGTMIWIEWVYAILFLEGGKIKKLIYVLIYDVVLSLASMVVVYGAAFAFDLEVDKLIQPGTSYRLLLLACNKALILLLLSAVIQLERKKQQEYWEWKTALGGYAAVVMMTLAIIRFTKQQDFIKNTAAELLFWSTFAILVIGIILTVCVYRLNQQHQYKLENELLAAKLEEEKYMLQRTKEMYEENQILRHDLKKYLTIAQGMLKNNEIDELREYLSEILGGQFAGEQIYHTDSSVINSVLNDKAVICRRRNIRYAVAVSGTVGGSRQTDIGIILSNLIDNAIEAEEKESEGSIDVQISAHKGMLQIRVSNFISESVLGGNPNLHTGKKDRTRHGIGLRSVKKMVKSMDGTYVCEEREHYFITNIIVPDSANGA